MDTTSAFAGVLACCHDCSLAIFGYQAPFHAFTRLVRTSRDLIEVLAQGKVVPDRVLINVSFDDLSWVTRSTYLPTRAGQSVVSIMRFDPIVDTGQAKSLLLGGDDCPGDHRCIAAARLQVL